MGVSWERLGGFLGVLGCVLAVLVVLGRQHFRFFLNSGTLKGSSRIFKESQGVPASVPESGQSGLRHGPESGSRLVVGRRRSIRRWALCRALKTSNFIYFLFPFIYFYGF